MTDATGDGWYADPAARHQMRYQQDGRWTEHVSDDGATAIDPAPAAPMPPMPAASPFVESPVAPAAAAPPTPGPSPSRPSPRFSVKRNRLAWWLTIAALFLAMIPVFAELIRRVSDSSVELPGYGYLYSAATENHGGWLMQLALVLAFVAALVLIATGAPRRWRPTVFALVAIALGAFTIRNIMDFHSFLSYRAGDGVKILVIPIVSELLAITAIIVTVIVARNAKSSTPGQAAATGQHDQVAAQSQG